MKIVKIERILNQTDLGLSGKNGCEIPIASNIKPFFEHVSKDTILSFKDLKTYSVDYALTSADNAKNVDLKFYCMGKGSNVASEPRLYSINAAKSDEYKGSNGAGLNTAAVKNRTMLAKLSDFDYDNATVTSIASEISASLIVKEDLIPITEGDIIAADNCIEFIAEGCFIFILAIQN